MTRHFGVSSVVLATAMIVSAAPRGLAQNPVPPSAQNPETRTTPSAERQTVTIEGCLMQEQDIPGRQPNVAERAGIAEDYILTETKVVRGSARTEPSTSGSPGAAVGTSGTRSMYKVAGIDDERLKAAVHQRVRVQGTLAGTEGQLTTPPETPPPAGTSGSTTEHLPILRGTSIETVSGTCPASTNRD